MTTKAKDNLQALPPDAGKPAAPDGSDNGEFVFDQSLFDAEDVSVLQSILNFSCLENIDPVFKDSTKSASVKFMITMQDEADLDALGYSRGEIDRLKPQEAADILVAGTKAEPAVDRE